MRVLIFSIGHFLKAHNFRELLSEGGNVGSLSRLHHGWGLLSTRVLQLGRFDPDVSLAHKEGKLISIITIIRECVETYISVVGAGTMLSFKDPDFDCILDNVIAMESAIVFEKNEL